MTGFVIAAAVAVALVLVLLLRPFLGKAPAQSLTSRRQLNTSIYREQLAKLDQDLSDGTLSQQDYAQARAELQRRALEDTQEEDQVAKLHAPRRTLVTLALLVPLAAAGLYAVIGNPASMNPPGHGQSASDLDVERMVNTLAAKLEKEPDNQKGWALLARSYKAMGRSEEAERAFERAGSFIDNDAQMLAHYADVAASNADGKFAGKPAMLIEKALKADPNNGMALWLSGTAALEDNNYAKALETWQKLAAMLPPDSEDARMIQGAIADVQGRLAQSGGLKSAIASAGGKAGAAAAPPAPAPTAKASPQAAAAGGSVSGTVELDASLKGKAAPTDTVMVIARLPGTRMPLAVLRVPASQFPLKFRLDDSLAMNPQSPLSAAAEVEVEARISKTGMAKTEAGDLISPAQTVKVGASNVALRVAQVRQ